MEGLGVGGTGRLTLFSTPLGERSLDRGVHGHGPVETTEGKDPEQPRVRADERERSASRPRPHGATEQDTEAEVVEEVHSHEVDDNVDLPGRDELDEALPQPRRGRHVELAPQADDRVAVNRADVNPQR